MGDPPGQGAGGFNHMKVISPLPQTHNSVTMEQQVAAPTLRAWGGGGRLTCVSHLKGANLESGIEPLMPVPPLPLLLIGHQLYIIPAE